MSELKKKEKRIEKVKCNGEYEDYKKKKSWTKKTFKKKS